MAQDEHGAHGEWANGAARHEMYMFELRVCGLMMSLLREMRASPQSAHQASHPRFTRRFHDSAFLGRRGPGAAGPRSPLASPVGRVL